MQGFFGSYGKGRDWDLACFAGDSFVTRSYEAGDFHVNQVTLPKFLNDKYFAQIDGCFLATEGVLLEADSAADAISRYRKGETTFWDQWRGSFAGLLYDSQKETLLLFNDQIGSKMLFYAMVNGDLVFASDLRILAETIGANHLNQSFAHAILDKGYARDDSTFVQGVFRLTAGDYIRMEKNHFQCLPYHRFDNTPYAYDEDAMIAKTNQLFRQAVERVIRKNESEGLQHFFPLSGGLDSRLCQCVAHQMSKRPITNFTFSQTGHYDHMVPSEITRAWGNDWVFVPLDGGEYITHIDRTCARTEWIVNYMTPIEIDFFARTQQWDNVGVVLTGINGDNIFATETDNAHEMDRIYHQGLNGYSLGSPLIMQYYTETYSPFCDVDVLDYVLHVPTRKRHNYRFYDQLVLHCYPELAQWHHKHMSIGHRPITVTLFGRSFPLRELPMRFVKTVLRRLHIYDGYRITQESMNPYDWWAKQNPHILEQLRAYYDAHRDLITKYPWFKLCEEKMRIGAVMEKGKVLTVQSALTNLHIS